MTLLVRDEEDIIGQNLEFHLNNGVDFIVVTDNRSVDGTRDILEAYQRQGVLHYIYESEDDYAQSLWVTRMAKLGITKFGADWVINNDADEFWYAEHKKDLKEVLRDIPASLSGLSVRRHNFVACTDAIGLNFIETMIYRQAMSENGLGKPLPMKVCHRSFADFSVAQGNHNVSMGGTGLSMPVTEELCIFHFPMRTFAQFQNKIKNGGAALARSNLPIEICDVWRKLYELHRQEGLEQYFSEMVYDQQRLHRSLEEGVLVKDQRLLTFFKEKGLSVEPEYDH